MKKLDIFKLKKDYVEKKVLEGNFTMLSEPIAQGVVAKVDGIGTIDNDKYEIEYLYIQKGGYIRKHQHTDNMELYRVISGDASMECDVCLIGEEHEIKPFTCNTIVEVLKLKNPKSNNLNPILTNKCVKGLVEDFLRKYDRLLNSIALKRSENQSLDKIAKYCHISIDWLKKVNDMYFSNRDSIPFIMPLYNINLDKEKEDNYNKYKVRKILPSFFKDWDGTFKKDQTIYVPGLSGSK